ncbi:MAG: M16 family metallopeptidase [Bacteroidota bacterium]|jgi:zinc protease
MKAKSILLLLFLLAVGFAVHADKILPYQIIQKKLPNGLNVVTVPFPSPGVASFHIVVRVGSRDEVEKGKTGFAHFFEHMMFRGTEKYSKELYSDALKATGASANANTSLDRTVYHMTGSAKYLEKMFELEADRFMNLKYSVQDFKTEAGAVKGEYTKNNASPYTRLYEAVNNTAFDKHTYKHTTMGFFEDIVAMPDQYDFSLEFFDRYYRPEYCTIIVVGDVDPGQVNSLAMTYFGDWKKGSYTQSIPVEPAPTATRTVNVKAEKFPPYLDLKFRGPAFSTQNNDYQALVLLGQLLSSEKSELHKQLVMEERTARSLSGGIFPTRDPYLFSLSASLTNAADFPKVKKRMLDAISKFQTNAVSESELNAAKERVKYSFALAMDNPDAIANSLGQFTWLTGDPESLNASYAILQSVTADDIMRVAKKYLVSKGMTIGTISPVDNPVLD